ncbi:hypothetical protein [Mycobacteroides abscessus]|uniref:hypothetical protein n=1 Tax=Mycobacteroides abscessus TaxID=36809 RepID=UPI0005DE5F54|nr:hypothetical protein [Mycobacteroides abscessus]CPW67252.1 Uncharacterised protein [Mycobacteroides abscessus]SKF61992.1 Uncharacterised protein [Mycobacteroides abscessus subsp. bolletii]SKH90147.1 Uncharacterised protein [Mycobacteroides abscessus subsp. bolletii]
MSGEIVPASANGDNDPPFLGKGDLKRLLLARSYGASDETIAREFGWTVEELHALLGVELP